MPSKVILIIRSHSWQLEEWGPWFWCDQGVTPLLFTLASLRLLHVPNFGIAHPPPKILISLLPWRSISGMNYRLCGCSWSPDGKWYSPSLLPPPPTHSSPPNTFVSLCSQPCVMTLTFNSEGSEPLVIMPFFISHCLSTCPFIIKNGQGIPRNVLLVLLRDSLPSQEWCILSF